MTKDTQKRRNDAKKDRQRQQNDDVKLNEVIEYMNSKKGL